MIDMTTTLRAALAALALIGTLLVASPAHAEDLPPCAPTAIVFDFCTKTPDVEYPGEDGGTVTPAPEGIIGTYLLCPDGSYGRVIDLDYTVDCTEDLGSPATVEVVEPPVAAPAPAASPAQLQQAEVEPATVAAPAAVPTPGADVWTTVLAFLRGILGSLFSV